MEVLPSRYPWQDMLAFSTYADGEHVRLSVHHGLSRPLTSPPLAAVDSRRQWQVVGVTYTRRCVSFFSCM